MNSDIDGLRASYTSTPDHSNQMALLEGTVSRIDSEFVALCTLLAKQSVPNMSGDSRTMPTEDTLESPDDGDTDRSQRKSLPELEGRRDVTAKATLESTDTMNKPHPLFPNADPAYRIKRVPQGPEVVQATTTSPPTQDNQWSRPPPMESQRSPFWQDQFRRNTYQAHPYAPPQSTGTIKQHVEESRRMGPPEKDVRYDEDEASLGGGNSIPSER
jgi:hypothetical protein